MCRTKRGDDLIIDSPLDLLFYLIFIARLLCLVATSGTPLLRMHDVPWIWCTLIELLDLFVVL